MYYSDHCKGCYQPLDWVRSHKSAGQGGFAEFELSCQNRNTVFKPPWLKSAWLCGLAEALTAFGEPSQEFLQVLGISPKLLESSSRKAGCSIGFPCGLSVSSAIPEYLSHHCTVLEAKKQHLCAASHNTFGAFTNISRQESAYFRCKLQFLFLAGSGCAMFQIWTGFSKFQLKSSIIYHMRDLHIS